MEVKSCPACVELVIPCKPEYVGVARLAILGIASRMRFSYDEVEDVRLAVGEACTVSVDWAEINGKEDATIILKSQITSDKLIIDVIDKAGRRGEQGRNGNSELEQENLGALLITLLVDEVEVTMDDSGTQVRMVKNARQR